MAQPLQPVATRTILPVAGGLPVMPNTRLWLIATIISAISAAHFVKKFFEVQKYQCTLSPKVILLGMRMPQMQAIFLTAAASCMLIGLFSVTMLQLTRRVEQFFVE